VWLHKLQNQDEAVKAAWSELSISTSGADLIPNLLPR
jgi:hypothetical protein